MYEMDFKELLQKLENYAEELEGQMDSTNFDSDSNPFEDNPFMDQFNQQVENSQDESIVRDVFEDDDEIVVVVDVPGYKEENISLTADSNQVHVSAEATDDMHRDDFDRVFRLPAEVEAEQSEAALEKGVLTITLPRVEPEDQTTISISDS